MKCYLRAQSELRASPRNPNVSTCIKSEKSLSLEVWCFKAAEVERTQISYYSPKLKSFRFDNVFERSLSCSPRLNLFDQKYSKQNNNIVKLCCNLK